MKINLFNALIFLGFLFLLSISIWKILKNKNKDKVFHFFYGFLITSSLVIIMVLLFDLGVVRLHPWIVIFFIPFQYLAPVYFIAFICYYLKKREIYIKNKKYLFLPFVLFFLLYTVLKINIYFGHPWISKEVVTIIHTEVDENSALAFSTILGIWGFLIIRRYESTLGKFSFVQVKKKTGWIKNLLFIFITFNIIWLLTIILFFIREDISGHIPYYPYWILCLLFYFSFLFFGSKHIKELSAKTGTTISEIEKSISNFQMSGLQDIFSKAELELIYENPSKVTGILSYFATSLFDKNKADEVLWDITENCISQLRLEDVVVYMLDQQNNTLVQKAAFGNKNNGERKILSPIEIPLGKGIVGKVAQSGNYESIGNVTKDQRYIKDDLHRKSELSVPIYIDSQIVGVLDSEHSQKDFFTENHIVLFKLIATLTGKKLAQIHNKNITITNDNIYFKELDFLMKEAKVYRDTHLSLDSISKRLKISSNYLSQLVNRLSKKSFTDYVNGFRVEDAKSKLRDPNFNKYTIIAIALESGFNSKSTFYSAFKKQAGISPKEYRDNPSK